MPTIVSGVKQVLPEVTPEHALLDDARLLQLDSLRPRVEEQTQERDELPVLL